MIKILIIENMTINLHERFLSCEAVIHPSFRHFLLSDSLRC